MTAQEIQNILRHNKDDIAFIIGNGINRYASNNSALSWDDLLTGLWGKVSENGPIRRPRGISLTEFYDILEIENSKGLNLQKEVATIMALWEPQDPHKNIVRRIREMNVPILTLILRKRLQRRSIMSS